jgi:hypothetical protein
MDCPQCGYVLDPFENSCPKCAKTGRAAISTVAAAPAPPVMASPPVATPQPVTPQPVPRQVRRPAPPKERYEPPLGWFLTILLWVVGGLNVVVMILLIIVSIVAHYLGGSNNPGAMAFFLAIIPGIRMAACIGMLRGGRWGFWLFCVFSVIPVGLSIMMGNMNIFTFIFDALPALVIFFLALGKMNELE